jgi:hypothetical protein
MTMLEDAAIGAGASTIIARRFDTIEIEQIDFDRPREMSQPGGRAGWDVSVASRAGRPLVGRVFAVAATERPIRSPGRS